MRWQRDRDVIGGEEVVIPMKGDRQSERKRARGRDRMRAKKRRSEREKVQERESPVEKSP